MREVAFARQSVYDQHLDALMIPALAFRAVKSWHIMALAFIKASLKEYSVKRQSPRENLSANQYTKPSPES
jgi:hypothetical protein